MCSIRHNREGRSAKIQRSGILEVSKTHWLVDRGYKEAMGTELFRSPDAVFYLSDPISGMLGFARDGYLNTFTYNVQPGQRMNIAIEGDNMTTRLFINGKQVEEMNIQERWMDKEGKTRIRNVRTLVFPLEKAGNFKSKITNLKVEQK